MGVRESDFCMCEKENVYMYVCVTVRELCVVKRCARKWKCACYFEQK